jgi:hypothetical protein
VHCSLLALGFRLIRQHRMMDIQLDLHVHPCHTHRVGGWRIVGFQCANSGLVDEEGPQMVLAAHFAEGQMLLRFAG